MQYHVKVVCGLDAEIIYIRPPKPGRGAHAMAVNMQNIELDQFCRHWGITADDIRELVANPSEYNRLGKVVTDWYEDWAKRKYIYEL